MKVRRAWCGVVWCGADIKARRGEARGVDGCKLSKVGEEVRCMKWKIR